MALPMVHLAVAHALAELQGEGKGCGEYFLGAIAPDAVHMRPEYDKKYKAASHFTADKSRSKDPQEWTADTLSMLDGRRDDPFSLGYIVHVLTDILWAQGLGGRIHDAYDADPAPGQTRAAAYYNDTDLIDISLYKSVPWRPKVFEGIKKAPARAFEDLITEEDCEAWRERTVKWYVEHDESMYVPMRYVTQEDIDLFVQDTAEKISGLLSISR